MHCHCLTVVTTRVTFVVVMIEVSQSVMNFQQRHSIHITVRVSPSCFFAFRFDYLFYFSDLQIRSSVFSMDGYIFCICRFLYFLGSGVECLETEVP